MLPVSSPRQRHLRRAIGQIPQRRQSAAELAQQHGVHTPQLQDLTCLRDVLRRRAPVGVPASIVFADPI